MEIETQIRLGIRDAVNRGSRKPFHWGGLSGYHQLEGIAEALRSMPQDPAAAYLHRLHIQVEHALQKNRWLAQDLDQAHRWLIRIAECLRYPCSSFPASEVWGGGLSSTLVRCEMEALLEQFHPDLKRQAAQRALDHAWRRLWQTCGSDLLPCYDIHGLPPDNLKMETLFGRLRGHQRRISGHKSTRPLRDFGQYQVLFDAQNEEQLRQQLQQASQEDYREHRRRLIKAEEPRQQRHRLHRNPAATARCLVERHAVRRVELARTAATPLGHSP
jgi:hypothetical protein